MIHVGDEVMNAGTFGSKTCVRAAFVASPGGDKPRPYNTKVGSAPVFFALCLGLLVGLTTASGAYAQNPSQSEIDQFLDGGWGQPGNAPAPAQNPQAFQGQQFGQFMQNQAQSPLRLPQGRSFPAFPGGPREAGNAGRPISTPFGKLTPQEIFRIMFGGGSAPGSPQDPGRNSGAIYGAQGQLQVARDQAAQAESAASRAQYGSSSERRSQAAQAQNHANAARAAADSATAQAGGGPSEAQNAAAQARNEAARAQYAADRAHANAAGAGW